MHILVTKRITFSAAHFYWLSDCSEAENQQLFKGCSNRNGHGHNYVAEVTIQGPVDEQTGMLANLKDLKRILTEEIIQPLDHKNLNLEIPEFQTQIPTLENIALYIWKRLHPRMDALSATLKCLKLIENETLYVEYYGETIALAG